MEEKNADLLLTPSAKKNSKFKREYPFPIVTPGCKENETDPNFKIAEGYLHENCVLVHDEESMKMLYCMGFFGKGTLSKNAPKICFRKTTQPKKQNQRSVPVTPVDAPVSPVDAPVSPVDGTASPDDIIDVVDSDDEASKPKKAKLSNEDQVLVSNSSDSDFDEHPEVGRRKNPDLEEKESLQLGFQEAYFLSYGLGCLVVKDKDKMLNVAQLWRKFCELTPSGNFPVMYTAYHHFRSKGWIVKNGLKFGTDYVLYKDGPPFYHATYSVIVQTLKENLKDVKGNRELTWASLAALNRVNNTAGKALLFLYVIKPNILDDTSPYCIPKFKLEEVLYKRWVAAENREEIEPCTSQQSQ